MFSILKNYLLIFILFSVASCQSYHPLSQQNYFNGSTLYNDPLNLKLEYFGDIDFHPLTEIKKKKIRNILQDIEGNKVRDLLAYGSTNMDPEYEILLILKDLEKAEQVKEGVRLILRDTIHKKVVYSKSDGKYQAFLILKSERSKKSMQSITNDGLSLMKNLSFDAHLKEELDYSKVFGTIRENPNYLFGREKLKEAPIPETEESSWMQFQYLATINSFMTANPQYEDMIRKYEDKRKRDLRPILDTVLDNSGITTNREVLEEIAALSSQTQVVMLNENHWYPKHRQLALSLLKPLKEKGYTFLALEALFQDQDKEINSRGYPTFNSGYYTRETFFGHLIRTAVKLGFEILDYENYDRNIDRELGQAQNLAQIFKGKPDAKVFVYAGLDHIIEEPTARGESMAVNFKEITGIDPLTINQVDLVSEISHNLVLLPFELLKQNEKLRKKPVDLFVINNLDPRLRSIFPEKDLEKVVIENENLAKHAGEDLLIKVYHLKEYKLFRSQSVPILSTIKRISPDNQLEISLPRGDYAVRVLAGEDDKVLLKEIRMCGSTYSRN